MPQNMKKLYKNTWRGENKMIKSLDMNDVTTDYIPDDISVPQTSQHLFFPNMSVTGR